MTQGTLILGDCLATLPLLAPGSVDLVLADLPYGTTQNRWDSVIPFEVLWPELLRVATPTAALVFTASQPFTSALVMSQPKLFRHEWIWHKNRGSNFANTGREPFKEHESVLVFSRGGWVYNKQMQERTGGGVGLIGKHVVQNRASQNYRAGLVDTTPRIVSPLRVPSSVQKFNTQVGLHPTQKPVALFEYLIRTYTDPGDVVLDPTAGSGTTAVAAQQSGRRWVCIERDEAYFSTTRTRLLDMGPQAAPKVLGALF